MLETRLTRAESGPISISLSCMSDKDKKETIIIDDGGRADRDLLVEAHNERVIHQDVVWLYETACVIIDE